MNEFWVVVGAAIIGLVCGLVFAIEGISGSINKECQEYGEYQSGKWKMTCQSREKGQ